MMLTQQEGEFLIKIAREAFDTFARKFEVISPPKKFSNNLSKRRGIFVRILKFFKAPRVKNAKILGCLGYLLPLKPIIATTIDVSVALAARINKSPSFHIDKISDLLFEVSVLNNPKFIVVNKATDYPNKIELGKDGLIVEYGFAKGFTLPQEVIENSWNEIDVISECCIRAGLLADAWLTNPSVKLLKFQAEIFRESEIEHNKRQNRAVVTKKFDAI